MAKQTKTEVKHSAQDALMSAMQIAFDRGEDDPAIREEMDKQFQRVEKLFGYVPGSFNRGS